MKLCEKCRSEEIKEEVISFEDLHNIMKVFTCLRCGFEKSEKFNVQEGE
jgi:predicted nucleic-acid-binding Zn-ribbon protein